MRNLITYRYNVMGINSLEAFMGIRGGCNNSLRDVYFVRALGVSSSMIDVIKKIDEKAGKDTYDGKMDYFRLKRLPKLSEEKDILFYSGEYDNWLKAGKNISLKSVMMSEDLSNMVAHALQNISNVYKKCKLGVSESMIRNLSTKMLFWLDGIAKEILCKWNESRSIKIVAENIKKEQEYLFFYFLTQIGCDVLLLEMKEDVSVSEELKGLSSAFKLGEFEDLTLPEFVRYTPPKEKNKVSTITKKENPWEPVRVIIPEHNRSKKKAQTNSTMAITQSEIAIPQRTNIPTTPASTEGSNRSQAKEKSFEELAQLASSIVMIEVHDANGNVEGTGSGIMIGKDGYILTNFHVINGGCYFSVRIEDDEEVYVTDEVIKYNTNLDMAIIRIKRKLQPLPIYNGKQKLVRGQKVVAIGSPLGLFNSVSDGIISGFRTIRDEDMIQFTAPISPGSSGGAVLNMQGEVIGISTAGLDNGQNINLAVGYENILMFAKGFY
ncbi:MAG: trypsin-like serine protease [Epulopiscium sp.]|jgi:serine protease Do|nr:trypsin-like serine protease [Candidatus Epulonipiscium sp.]